MKHVSIVAVLVLIGLFGAACSSGLSDELDSTPSVVATPTPAAGVACSPVDLSEVPELLRPYAKGVACIQADGRQGTGFVVRNTTSGEGYLVTNAHVVGVDTTNVSVQLDGAAYSAEVIQTSVERDLAMIRVCCGDFVVLKRTNRAERNGEWVGVLGFPDGEFTYSSGVVRGVVHGSLNTYLEHTADVQPGGSGGPLLSFPLEAVLRVGEGKGWGLEEGESLGVLGVTSAKSLEYEYTTYTIYQTDVSQFVNSVWSTLGLEGTHLPTIPQYTIDW